VKESKRRSLLKFSGGRAGKYAKGFHPITQHNGYRLTCFSGGDTLSTIISMISEVKAWNIWLDLGPLSVGWVSSFWVAPRFGLFRYIPKNSRPLRPVNPKPRREKAIFKTKNGYRRRAPVATSWSETFKSSELTQFSVLSESCSPHSACW